MYVFYYMSVRQGYYGLVRQNGPFRLTPRDVQNLNAPAPSDPSDFTSIRPYVSSSKPSSNPSKYAIREIKYKPYMATSRGVKIPLGTLKRPQGVNLPPGVATNQDFLQGPVESSSGPTGPDVKTELKDERFSQEAPDVTYPVVAEESGGELASGISNAVSQALQAAGSGAKGAIRASARASDIANSVSSYTRQVLPIVGMMVNTGDMAVETGVILLFGRDIGAPINQVLRTHADLRTQFTRWLIDHSLTNMADWARTQVGDILTNPLPYFGGAAVYYLGHLYQPVGTDQPPALLPPPAADPLLSTGTRTEYVPSATEPLRFQYEYEYNLPPARVNSLRRVVLSALQYSPQLQHAGQLGGGSAAIMAGNRGAARALEGALRNMMNINMNDVYGHDLRPLTHRVARLVQRRSAMGPAQ